MEHLIKATMERYGQIFQCVCLFRFCGFSRFDLNNDCQATQAMWWESYLAFVAWKVNWPLWQEVDTGLGGLMFM